MNKQRLLYCVLVSLVMIPVFVFSCIGFVHNYQSYHTEIIEKEFTYLGCDTQSSRYGLYLKVKDDAGNIKEIIFSTNDFSSQWDFLDEVKVGEQICVFFSKSDTEESYVAGLRTDNKVYYGEKANQKEDIAMMMLYAMFAFLSLVIEIVFLFGSKNIFKKKPRIVARTDRPVTEDMFKESFFE